jgi:hypothetical protein
MRSGFLGFSGFLGKIGMIVFDQDDLAMPKDFEVRAFLGIAVFLQVTERHASVFQSPSKCLDSCPFGIFVLLIDRTANPNVLVQDIHGGVENASNRVAHQELLVVTGVLPVKNAAQEPFDVFHQKRCSHFQKDVGVFQGIIDAVDVGVFAFIKNADRTYASERFVSRVVQERAHGVGEGCCEEVYLSHGLYFRMLKGGEGLAPVRAVADSSGQVNNCSPS